MLTVSQGLASANAVWSIGVHLQRCVWCHTHGPSIMHVFIMHTPAVADATAAAAAAVAGSDTAQRVQWVRSWSGHCAVQAAAVVPHQQSTLGSKQPPTGCSHRFGRLQDRTACRRQPDGLLISCDGYMLLLYYAENLITELALSDCHGELCCDFCTLLQQLHKLTVTEAGMSLFRADSCICQCGVPAQQRCRACICKYKGDVSSPENMGLSSIPYWRL